MHERQRYYQYNCPIEYISKIIKLYRDNLLRSSSPLHPLSSYGNLELVDTVANVVLNMGPYLLCLVNVCDYYCCLNCWLILLWVRFL